MAKDPRADVKELLDILGRSQSSRELVARKPVDFESEFTKFDFELSGFPFSA